MKYTLAYSCQAAKLNIFYTARWAKKDHFNTVLQG